MRIQLLSDLHLESEDFEPQPHPQADVLVLAGDIDSSWRALDRFAGWPVPALLVAGNHEFDGRELDHAWPALRERCERVGLRLIESQALVLDAPDGRRIRFLGTVRWCDFNVFGPTRLASALRAGSYFQRVMGATRGGAVFDAAPSAQRRWPAAPGWRTRWRSRLVAGGMPRWRSPTSRRACAVLIRATANKAVRRVFAMPTTICCPVPRCGCTATCIAATTTR